MSSNISWSKSIGNWGKNEDISKEKIDGEKEEVIILSFEEKVSAKEEIITICNELVEKSIDLYENFSNKELYDAIVTLMSAKKALDLIQVKNHKTTKKENA